MFSCLLLRCLINVLALMLGAGYRHMRAVGIVLIVSVVIPFMFEVALTDSLVDKFRAEQYWI